MEFEWVYTQEMEQFRQEVRAWLEENVPEEMKTPIDSAESSEERHRFWREKSKELGAKGWLYPTLPKQYGGGGLTGWHETVLREEFARHRGGVTIGGGLFLHPALLVWATEEQKQKFLVPLLRGEISIWQKYTEPHSGSDLASYESRAVRDGDDWLLTGSNAFCSGRDTPNYLFGPMLTDPDAPRHRNLGYFMIPVPSPGLEIQAQNLVNGSDQHFIFLDNVRVPGDHLIGGDHQGWQVVNTSLEREHGGEGTPVYGARDAVVDNLLSYMQEKRQKGGSAGPDRDPVIQQTAMDAHIDRHIFSLFSKRTGWLYQRGVEMTWEGPTSGLFERLYSWRNVARVRDVYGMRALLGAKEARAPHGGAQEVNQRTSFVLVHGAGSLNIQKVIVARRIGISRTRERAAPTPMTATRTPSSG